MSYAPEVAASVDECISMATASNPTGPFTDTSSAPLICQTVLGGSIDPQPFVDLNGVPYLYWKSNSGQSSLPAIIWAALLTADGSSLAPSAHTGAQQDQ